MWKNRPISQHYGNDDSDDDEPSTLTSARNEGDRALLVSVEESPEPPEVNAHPTDPFDLDEPKNKQQEVNDPFDIDNEQKRRTSCSSSSLSSGTAIFDEITEGKSEAEDQAVAKEEEEKSLLSDSSPSPSVTASNAVQSPAPQPVVSTPGQAKYFNAVLAGDGEDDDIVFEEMEADFFSPDGESADCSNVAPVIWQSTTSKSEETAVVLFDSEQSSSALRQQNFSEASHTKGPYAKRYAPKRVLDSDALRAEREIEELTFHPCIPKRANDDSAGSMNKKAPTYMLPVRKTKPSPANCRQELFHPKISERSQKLAERRIKKRQEQKPLSPAREKSHQRNKETHFEVPTYHPNIAPHRSDMFRLPVHLRPHATNLSRADLDEHRKR